MMPRFICGECTFETDDRGESIEHVTDTRHEMWERDLLPSEDVPLPGRQVTLNEI